MRDIAEKFQGEPLVVLSVSLDTDERRWKAFVAKNEMIGLQYRDDGVTGPIAKGFRVHEIPHTFTIDADGVLPDEHIGDASIEGKLKKPANAHGSCRQRQNRHRKTNVSQFRSLRRPAKGLSLQGLWTRTSRFRQGDPLFPYKTS
jgi:hypothetical protein